MMTLVADHATGDTVCTGCGVVVEAHEMVNCFYDNTEVAPRKQPARKKQRRSDWLEPQVANRDAEDKIRACMSNLRVTSGDVLRWAKELYNDANEAKAVRGEDARRSFAAAAVYFACKMCGEASRELRLVSGCGGVDPAALNAAVAACKERLASKPYHGRLFDAVSAPQLVNMYTGLLPVDGESLRRVRRDAHALHLALDGVLDCSRAPRTICSALTWLAVCKNGLKGVSKRDVAKACDVCIQSIDKCLADIFEIKPSLRVVV
jgi:transcription initiation factor TFIIIB Brf1 subunit/transcription initiation factor TFIIB